MYETQLCAKNTQNNKIEKVKSSVAEDEMSMENKRQGQVKRSDDVEREGGLGAAWLK